MSSPGFVCPLLCHPHHHKVAAEAPSITSSQINLKPEEECRVKMIIFSLALLLPGSKSFLRIPWCLLTSHWPGVGPSPDYQQGSGFQDWLEPIVLHSLGLGMNPAEQKTTLLVRKKGNVCKAGSYTGRWARTPRAGCQASKLFALWGEAPGGGKGQQQLRKQNKGIFRSRVGLKGRCQTRATIHIPVKKRGGHSCVSYSRRCWESYAQEPSNSTF